MALLRTVLHDPLTTKEREHLDLYHRYKKGFEHDSSIIKLYYENLEHKARVYELLLSFGIQPYTTDSVHDYKRQAHQELYRRVARGWLIRYIIAWAAIIVGIGLAIIGLVSFFVRIVMPPAVWFILALICVGYGAYQCWLRYNDLSQTEQRWWVKYSYSTYGGTLPLDFITVAECIRACVADAYIVVEDLGQGQFLLLTVEWRSYKYRLAEWHSTQ